MRPSSVDEPSCVTSRYVDCAGVGFVDSAGLAALCQMAERNVASGGPLHVLASDALRRTVELNGVGHLFDLD